MITQWKINGNGKSKENNHKLKSGLSDFPIEKYELNGGVIFHYWRCDILFIYGRTNGPMEEAQ